MKDGKDGLLVYFEEFRTGDVYRLEPVSMSAEAIVTFAREFDPQRIHVDPSFAAEGPFGGLIASGYHTLVAVWKRWIEAGALGDESMGGPGLDQVKWLAPVRPDDRLNATVTIAAVRRSQSLERGIVSLHFDVVNQDGVRVMTCDGAVMVRLTPV